MAFLEGQARHYIEVIHLLGRESSVAPKEWDDDDVI